MKKILLSIVLIIILAVFTGLKTIADDVNWIQGPKSIPLAGDVAGFYLPDNFVFADSEEGQKHLKKNSIKTSGNEAGLIMASDETQMWFILLEYKNVGYVKEEYLVDIDARGFYDGMKLANDASKSQFVNPMMPEVELAGYEEEPAYDSTTQLLKSAIKVKQGKTDLINYLLMKFGRNGVLNIRLVCEADEFPVLKSKVDKIVENIQFNFGYKYADFDSDKDKYAFDRDSDLLDFLTNSTGKKTDKLTNPHKPIFNTTQASGKTSTKSNKVDSIGINNPFGGGKIFTPLLFIGGAVIVLILYCVIKAIIS